MQKGLIISDLGLATEALRQHGLHRFKGFAHVYRDLNHPGKPFIPGTRFEDVERLIDLDERLRLVVLAGMQIVEIGVRQRINQQMSESHGADWYVQSANFQPSAASFHESFLNDVGREVANSRENVFEHFRAKNAGPFPPSWMMAELMTLGAWSRVYANLQILDQRAIAQAFPLHESTLRAWLRNLTVVRNVAAHHGRLWNRSFLTMPIADEHPKYLRQTLRAHSFDLNDPQALRVAPRLYALHFLTHAMAPRRAWRQDLQAALAPFTVAELPRLGFRPAWSSRPEWR